MKNCIFFGEKISQKYYNLKKLQKAFENLKISKILK